MKNVQTPQTILVVDDEIAITDLVCLALKYEGFDPISASTAREARTMIVESHPELVILDIGLPDQDGLTLMQQLRNEGINVPVMFLTARDTVDVKIRGLTIGGDDFVTKPFSIEELVARIRVVLRRHSSLPPQDHLYTLGDLEMNDDVHEVCRSNELISLTNTEYRLLRYLLINAGHVVSRSQIIDHVWNYDFGGDASILDTYISYLRRKVDVNHQQLIHTVRGIGFILRLPAQLS